MRKAANVNSGIGVVTMEAVPAYFAREVPRKLAWWVISSFCLGACLAGCFYTWRVIILSCLNIRGCFEEKATLAETLGTYRGAVPGGNANLAVNGDGSWDYRIEDRQGQAKFQRVGRWKYDQVEFQHEGRWKYDIARITLVDFEFGFRRHVDESDPPKPIFWIPLITNRGICFFPGKLNCLHKIPESSMLPDAGGQQ